MRCSLVRFGVYLVFAASPFVAYASSIDDLRQEVERLKKEVAVHAAPEIPIEQKYPGSVDACSSAVAVRSRATLTVGGLLQVWYQSVQNDRRGIVFNSPVSDLSGESNQTNDNDTFRIRRAELRFVADVDEHFSAHVTLDPARESSASFYPLPTFMNHNRLLSPALPNTTLGGVPVAAGTRTTLSANQITPLLLEDAYISIHDWLPHHEVLLGQMKPPSGAEAWTDNGDLDFVERSLIAQASDIRDIGVMVHGTWFCERLQYWVGAFNGPDGTTLADTENVTGANRADDNNDKDFAWRVLARPVWNADAWSGRLEVGYARTDGYRGSSGQAFDASTPLNALNEQRTAINRQNAWLTYRPGGVLRGVWARGEWESQHARFSAFRGRTNLLGTGSDAASIDGTTVIFGQLNPAPVTASGWSASAGYRLSESRFAACSCDSSGLRQALNNLEFAFRAEQYENVAAESFVNPDRATNLYRTRVYTGGVNYYMSAASKLQLNYGIVKDPRSGALRDVRNNFLALNFQVGF